MARSWFQVEKRILWVLAHRNDIVYMYGSKGKLDSKGNPRPMTESDIRYFMAAEPDYFSRYNAAEKQQIIVNSTGKIGFDCSGLVCWLTGETGYSREIYAKRTVETSFADGLQCQFIFTDFDQPNKRHIMLDAGYGYIIHVAYESTDLNIAKGKAGVLLQTLADWEKMFNKHTLHSFQTAAVNYAGAYSTDPNAAPAPEPTGKTGTVVNCTAVNLRQGPTTDCNVCTVNLDDGKGWRHVLYMGESAEVIGSENGWYQVLLKGQGYTWTPWVKSTYLSVK